MRMCFQVTARELPAAEAAVGATCCDNNEDALTQREVGSDLDEVRGLKLSIIDAYACALQQRCIR